MGDGGERGVELLLAVGLVQRHAERTETLLQLQ